MSAWTAGQEAQKAAEKKPKFLEDSGMSFQEVIDFATFTASRKKLHLDPFMGRVLNVTYIEDSEKACEYKITACLFAETFREAEDARKRLAGLKGQ